VIIHFYSDNFGVCCALLCLAIRLLTDLADFKLGNICLFTLTFSLNVNQICAWVRDLRLQGEFSRTIDLLGTPEIDELSEKKQTEIKITRLYSDHIHTGIHNQFSLFKHLP